jgi:hypothetical protein
MNACDHRGMASENEDDPRKWRIDVLQDRVDLYLSLKDEPRALTAEEAVMMVELVDAWRSHEHRKHVALMAALDQRSRG